MYTPRKLEHQLKDADVKAAVTAIPAIIGLSSNNVHSSLVKFVLSDIASSASACTETLAVPPIPITRDAP